MSSRSVPKILVVDDTDDVRRVHACFLDGAGMQVLTAENGTLALDLARRAVPDVIVTDVEMPVMDGLDLCRNVRADAAIRGVAVVVVTGDASLHTRAALDAGCNVVLGKPCSRTLLLATIRLLLEEQVTAGTVAFGACLD
jgi:chemosensory pili system protein ChpA (sensor histidine kinase/response regulator)